MNIKLPCWQQLVNFSLDNLVKMSGKNQKVESSPRGWKRQTLYEFNQLFKNLLHWRFTRKNMKVTQIEKRKLPKGKCLKSAIFVQKNLPTNIFLIFISRKFTKKHILLVVCPICAHAFSTGTYLKRHIEEKTRLHQRFEKFKLFNLD